MNLKDTQVTLVGLGRSSLAAARLLQREGARPFITESGNGPRINRWLDQATEHHIPCEIGGHTSEAFAGTDLVLLSPGVPLTAPCLNRPRNAGTPILGELEFACRFCTSRVLAVTGTNGKSTVTTLLESMVRKSGRTVALAGNNDTPLSQVILEATPPEYVVLEVSSYQLETVDQFHPAVSAVLNLTEDHLGRHGSMEGYAATKARIFSRQGAGDAVVLNADDPWTAAMRPPAEVECFHFSLQAKGKGTLFADDQHLYFEDTKIAPLTLNPLPGRHNLANVLAGLAVMKAAGFPWEGPLEGLRTFQGVEHRIEHVLNLDGADYYNDSKSTNEDSLRVALESFDRPILLIAGGRGKGGDYKTLVPLVRQHVKALIMIGEDTPKLEAAFATCVPAFRADSMMDALRRARENAEPGDVVLLSPGCASFDMYDNFEERGHDFKTCARRLAGEKRSEKERNL